MNREEKINQRLQLYMSYTDEQLYDLFWQATADLVDPLLTMAQEYTSPSIERSVLLRMGANSVEAKAIVEKCVESEILTYGAGHFIYFIKNHSELSLKEAISYCLDPIQFDLYAKKFIEAMI